MTRINYCIHRTTSSLTFFLHKMTQSHTKLYEEKGCCALLFKTQINILAALTRLPQWQSYKWIIANEFPPMNIYTKFLQWNSWSKPSKNLHQTKLSCSLLLLHIFFFNFNYNFLPQKFRKLSLQQKIPRVRRIYTDYQRELLIKEYLSHIILVGSEKMIRDPRQLCHNKISNTNSMQKLKKDKLKIMPIIMQNYWKLYQIFPTW